MMMMMMELSCDESVRVRVDCGCGFGSIGIYGKWKNVGKTDDKADGMKGETGTETRCGWRCDETCVDICVDFSSTTAANSLLLRVMAMRTQPPRRKIPGLRICGTYLPVVEIVTKCGTSRKRGSFPCPDSKSDLMAVREYVRSQTTNDR